MQASRRADKAYVALLRAIKDNGGVECEQYPDLYIAPDFVDSVTVSYDYKFTKTICDRCPVKDLCAEYAIVSRQTHGMWGGLSPKQIAKEFTRRFNYDFKRGRPRLNAPFIQDGDRQGQAEKSWSEPDLGSMHLSSSEDAEWGTGNSNQVLAWGEDWDSDAPLY